MGHRDPRQRCCNRSSPWARSWAKSHGGVVGQFESGGSFDLACSLATLRGMTDLNRMAARIVQESTEEAPAKTPAQTNGRTGGLKGGKARAAKLSPERRSEIARKAAQSRWRNSG